MDNQSNDSCPQTQIINEVSKKPNNRKTFSYRYLYLSSDFPGGNLQRVLFQQQLMMSGRVILLVQFWGNSDTELDSLDKSWFYFKVSGCREMKNMKYEQIIFRFKNANIYRKFIKEKNYRPYIAMREDRGDGERGNWKTMFFSKFNILQNQVIEAQFVYQCQSTIDCVYFAENLPYNLSDIENMHNRILESIGTTRNSKVYYHRQVIGRSLDNHPFYMLTITSSSNIESTTQNQPQIFDLPDNRPYLLKNRAEIVMTSRVHPSQSSSSYCVEGIIENLIDDDDFEVLLHMFVFRIIPMMNMDGVQNGHYRFDNNLKNLNRYYGHSDILKTPTVHATQKLISYLREKGKLFIFIDIHGHNSPKPSFIYGNYCQNFYQVLENRGNFDSTECQFSRKNMSIKQKYDQHSKQASARVFAYRGNSQEENNHGVLKNECFFVEHSYTLEIHPYISISTNGRKVTTRRNMKDGTSSSSTKNLGRVHHGNKRCQEMSTRNYSSCQIVGQYKKIGENVLKSILQLVGINTSLFGQNENIELIRRRIFKQLGKSSQFYERARKLRYRQIHRQITDRYLSKWRILQGYNQFLNSGLGSRESRIKIYEQHEVKREGNNKKMKPMMIRNGRKKLSLKTDLDVERTDEEIQSNRKRSQNLNGRENQFMVGAPYPSNRGGRNQLNKPPNILKSVQFDIAEMVQSRQIVKNMDMKMQGNTLTPKKRLQNSKNLEVEEIDKKIRRLIYRHKTFSQVGHKNDQLIKNGDNNKQLLQIKLLISQKIIQKNENNQKVAINKQNKKMKQFTKLQSINQSKNMNIGIGVGTINDGIDMGFNDRKIIHQTQKQLQNKIQKKQQQELKILKHSIKHFQNNGIQKIGMIQEVKNQKKVGIKCGDKYQSISFKQQARQIQYQHKLFHVNQYHRNVRGMRSIMTISQKAPNNLEQSVDLSLKISQQHSKIIQKKTEVLQTEKGLQKISKNQEGSKKSLKNGQEDIKCQFIRRLKRMLSKKKVTINTVEQSCLPSINQMKISENTKKNKWK